MVEGIPFVVVSCDAYRDVWLPFFHCFFKYWPDCPLPVYLGSNERTFVDPRVRPLMVGVDGGFGANTLAILTRLKSEWLVTCNEDILLDRRLDTQLVIGIIERGLRANAGCLKLITTPPMAAVRERNDLVGEVPAGSPYRVSFSLNLWRKEVLLALLRQTESAWDFERRGNRRADQMKESFLALDWRLARNPPIPFVHGIIKGRWTSAAVRLLKREGLVECLKGRPRQALSSGVYASLYVRLFRLRWVWEVRRQCEGVLRAAKGQAA
ncbi:MAG: hypothetical protein EPN53_04865 [Acidobacteria bacterium]|nr:MAG: hypothetical protein EPN53_04865 [Acidobacteriota bacterium]